MSPAIPEFGAIVAKHGGAGTVVSLYECLERYLALRRWLGSAAVDLPIDPRTLREWALVMVLTGTMNAVDRGEIAGGTEVVVHASGSYSEDQYSPLTNEQSVPVRDAGEVAEVLFEACRA